MYISIRIKDSGEEKLFVQPDIESGQPHTYILVKDSADISAPLLRLQLKGSHFEVCSVSDLIDEDPEELNEKLDQLALSVIDAEQRGDDLADVNLDDRIKPYNPELIRVDSKTFSLKQIFDMIGSGDLNLHPDFQRNLVWDDFRKSRLIESILLRIPLPMFYFYQDKEGVLSVVDGLQRLSAIREFMENKLVLRDLEHLDQCEGCTYSGKQSIDPKYFRWFNMTQIFVNIIDAQSPRKVKYDIFRRINTGGRPLNAQELRNSLAGDGLRQTLQSMTRLKSFVDATGGSVKDTRMDAQELALRFIYFYRLKEQDYAKGEEQYSGNMDDSLDEVVDLLGRRTEEELAVYVEKFDKSMKLAYYLFGRHAFRRVQPNTANESGRSVINKALFVSFSVTLAFCDENRLMAMSRHCLISQLGHAIEKDSTYKYYLSYGTNGWNNIVYAFKKAQAILNSLNHAAAGD